MKMVHEEISELLLGWKDNDKATAAQRETYDQSRKLPRKMLGNRKLDDGRDCLRLLRQDGWDGDYVGSVSPDTAVHYFYDDAIRPNDRDIFRIGMFFHIGFYKTLALILKNQWEQYLLKRMIEDKKDGGDSLINLIKNFENTKGYRDEFVQIVHEYEYEEAKTAEKAVDTYALYRMIQTHGGYAEKMGYDATDFNILIQNMLAAALYIQDINSETMDAFIERQDKEKDMLSGKEEIIKKKYAQMKARWFAQISLIEQLLQKQQDICQSNAQIIAKWAAEFGEKWTELCRLKDEYLTLSKYREIKEEHPSYSFAKVKLIAEESLAQQRKKLEEEIRAISRYEFIYKMNQRGLKVVGNAPGSSDDEIVQDIKRKQRKMLCKIYMLTHPDRTFHTTFTQQQREELLGIYHNMTQLSEFQGIELSMLDGIMHRATEVWENMGVDTAIIDTFPGGDTLDELLKNAVERLYDLEEKESSIRNDIHLLMEDEEVNIKEVNIADEVSIKRKHQELDTQIKEEKSKVEDIRSDIAQCFESGELAWN